ncbi:hypothetical protein [Dactylosporangium sp. CA-139066]|uniref:hypothetical protein n=1 Tax=Dactylosporangium sp. CA-139066 TaxID=3239930 RepID=UPI003D8AFDD5
MSEVELILTALMTGAAAGGTAGVTTAAQSAVLDAYTGLRDLLRRVLTRQGSSGEVLDAVEAAPGTWQTSLGEALTSAHADQDAQVLAAARTLLAAADPTSTAAGKNTVSISDSTGIQVGDHTTHIGTLNGPNIGETHAPMHLSYGQVADPPSRPGA